MKEEKGYEHLIKQDLGSLGFLSDVVYHDSTDSTNKEALRLAQQGKLEWTVVIADHQTGGRGRQGRVWYSPFNANIYTSFILRPCLPVEHLPAISLLAGMVVAMVIEYFTGMNVEVKWPNDVLVHNKKISGILLELGVDKENETFVVVGIGINVNSDIASYPDDIAGIALSMNSLTGKTYNRTEILKYLYRIFNKWYQVYVRNNGFKGIKDTFMRRFKMADEIVYIVDGKDRMSGLIKDIDDYGGLMIMDKNNKVNTIKTGDVHLIRAIV